MNPVVLFTQSKTYQKANTYLQPFMPPPTCILLQNPQFDAALSPWTISGSVSATTDSYAGTHAAVLSGFSSGIYQSKTGITVGRIYTVSAFGKIEGSVWWTWLGIRFRDNGGTILSDTYVNIFNTTYTQFTASATAPAGAVYVEVYATKLGGGNFKVDEFCLEETIPAIGQCVLVQNQSFENGKTNWTTSGGTVVNVADPQSGASAVQIASNGARIYQRVGILAGSTYELTAWAKVSVSAPTYAEIYINWKDANDNLISSIIQPVLPNVNSYTRFSLIGVAPANARYAEVGGYKTGSSTRYLYLDNFCLSLTNTLGGNSFPVGCGCADNLLPNADYEENFATFSYTFEGKPTAAIPHNNTTAVKPWRSNTNSNYSFIIQDVPNTVNNPKGDYFLWLPGNNDAWHSDVDFSNNLVLEDGKTYTLCFYAAAWAGNLNGSGLPAGGSAPQISGVVKLGFQHASGFKDVFAWSVPASASFTNLSWTKYTYTFTYSELDPISNFALAGSRNSVGVAIDAVHLAKTTCPQVVSCGTGGITFERWGSIAGNDVRELLTHPNFPNKYDETGVLPFFQGLTNFNDNYGTRVYGYLIPPQTGNYFFNVTSDDNARLYLSTDTTALKKALVASVPGWTNVTEHTKYPQQTSASIALQAGKKYFIELIHKEGTGGDHFQVYWQTPSNPSWVIIPGTALQPVCVQEICGNGKDDDFDGLNDCDDSDCSSGLDIGSVAVTDENCGMGGGAIDLQLTSNDLPLSFQWSDMPMAAWWTFEGTPNDASGNANHANGYVGNLVYSRDAVEGKNSIYFNGSTSIRYSVDNGFMEKAFSALSVAFWIKPDDFNGIQTLFDEGGSTSGRGLAIRLTNNLITAGVRDNGNNFVSDETHAVPNDGQWHHVAAVFNNGNFTVYLDGVPSPTQVAPFTSVGNHGNNGGLGGAFGGSVLNTGNTRYQGKIDDVRYITTGLTASQVADLARNDGDRTNLFAGNYTVIVKTASGCPRSETVTVNSSSNHTNGGTVAGDESACAAMFDPGLISNTTPPSGGGAGTTQYQWQQSTDGGTTWTDITGATAQTYDPPAIFTTTLYRRGGRLQPCLAWVYSNAVTKSFINNFSSAGTVSGDQTTCGAFDPTLINASEAPSGGNGGATEYQWQLSTDTISWTNIAGATSATFDPAPISQTTWYRRGARRSPCTAYIYSNPVMKSVVVNYTSSGIIAGDQSICGSFDPDVISSVTTPSGGTDGTLEYQWQQSADGGTTWSDVPGANAETFNPNTIITTTLYRRGARRAPCTAYIYSGSVTKWVVSNFTAGGVISADESVCGSYDPGLISNVTSPSGGLDGTPTYQWQASTDDGTTWTVIPSSDLLTYDPPTISQTTLYRRQSRRSPCAAWINSNTVTKTVKSFPTASIIAYPATTNGYICEWESYTFDAADAGVGATYAWDFGVYAIPASATGRGPHVVSFNVPNGAAFTTVSVQMTATVNGCPASQTMNFNIRPQIIVTNVNVNDPNNCNTANGSINVTASKPPETNIQASIDGGSTWKSEPLNFNNLLAGTYQLRLRYSGGECSYVWGNVVLKDPVVLSAGIQLSTTQTCNNQTFTVEAIQQGGGSQSFSWDFGAGATPVIATGQGPHTVSYSSGGVKDIVLTVTENLCSGTVDTTITIVSTYTDGGTIGSDEDLCSVGSGSMMSTVVAPSGGFGGTPGYQWERRVDDGSGGWTAWSDIGGATSENYTPASISVTTQFRRKARRLPCSDWAYSDEVTKRVSGMPVAKNDVYDSACPGFLFFNYVSLNDLNLVNPVYTIVTPPVNGSLDLDTDGEFVYTPNSSFCGSDQFTYRVCNNGTSCCATATATIDLSDSEVPVLQNVPANLVVSCDDDYPLPPIVNAWENCQTVILGMDEASDQGTIDSCSIYNYSLTRTWTAGDYCGNHASAQQVITIQDATAPDIYRIYTLPNGKRMVAGVMENVSQRWKTIEFPIQFGTIPVVLTQVITDNEQEAVVTRMRNISTSRFQLRLQEEEASGGNHAMESVAWVAFEPGSYSGSSLPFEIGSMLASSSNSVINFSPPIPSPGFIGTIQSFNENNPANIRINSLSSTSASIFCQEETSLDPETNHGFETVGYIALDGTGYIRNQSNEIVGETGRVSVDHNAVTVNLLNRYHNPVVILGGVTMNGSQPVTIRVRNVTATSFSVWVDEWEYLNQTHLVENLTYLVVEGSIPFDQYVECSAIPPKPVVGVNIVGKDNCDVSTPITITDSDFTFNCQNDTLFTRTYHVLDECGNTTTLVQRFFLRDTTPPTFTPPADITITCLSNKDSLALTGDVTDEADNCADGLDAVYTDNLTYLSGCSGYIIRIWSLSDLCENTAVKIQRITVYNDNDADGDGIADPFDLDSDNDGIPDIDEVTGDTDGDGIPNFQDLDSDNDGIPDLVEAGFPDKNGDGIIDSFGQPDWDVDGDGLANEADADDLNPSLLASDNFDPLSPTNDNDADGIPNFLDLDSDNDGIPDLIEAGGVDTDGDGVIDYPIPGNPASMSDADGDGFFDAYDPDIDNIFGIDQAGNVLIKYNNDIFSGGQNSFNPDQDGDGIPDYLDLDSDNDGIVDLIEAGGVDVDGNGRIEPGEFVDTNQNGFHDDYETTALIYTDADGGNQDGRPEDTNGDGTVYNGGDADKDNLPNHKDIDSDNDGINDIVETGYSNLDLDKNGRIDSVVDNNRDGFHDGSVGTIFTDSDGATLDGRPEDSADSDSSAYGSSKPDGSFGEANGNPDLDDDGDGLPNFIDTDSDNDLVSDNLEDKNGNGSQDSGETHWLDSDSDNDGISDGIEDANRDGFYEVGVETNPLSEDTDGDGIPDGVEDGNQNGVVDGGSESDPRDPCDPVANAACIGVVLNVKVRLFGAMMENNNSPYMRDDLRSKGLLPKKEPYGTLSNYEHVGGGGGETTTTDVLAVSGQNAIVDWIFVELRAGNDVGKVIATKSALLQRDGDVVENDGVSLMRFANVPSGSYYVIVRHRNHLGIATKSPIVLSPTPVTVDFIDPATEVHGSHSRTVVNGQCAIWSGDLNRDRKVIFQGPSNDVFPIFFHILTDPGNLQNLANFVSIGYSNLDINMDGATIYQGPNNDRQRVLIFGVLGSPENLNHLANFILYEKLP